jgi:hypothetical protein
MVPGMVPARVDSIFRGADTACQLSELLAVGEVTIKTIFPHLSNPAMLVIAFSFRAASNCAIAMPHCDSAQFEREKNQPMFAANRCRLAVAEKTT